ncbi:ABC transporter substrate-binding protein [Marinactinospora thermotolerans]|uniref:Carbohydrate ABC transporter substrate-binding protein, CUT1 family (TC 3.A.1.1.-) n=1 Tax=Marinactinospora thermotolerans DSM 45154 TaxID=1122192 RepID=A0A1T4JY49_9ACTN|nr:sugar ABC transporter substrate-binding protein [Marinactinospora thermotolerans]SJZ35039.1 carbohydrate ABC transporter substrate-binding protein, CUT1 family (TC 3.A.1.1.-) [Marinactinospora thermotolerans DSM 45154]
MRAVPPATGDPVRRPLPAALAVATAGALTLSGCAGAGAINAGGEDPLVVAIVANPQMQDAIALQSHFEAEHPGIEVNFVTLPENEARAKITTSVATEGGEFDVVMISNYETAQWAENGWLTNLQPHIDATEGYDADDFIPTVRESLSYEGDMYSVPFYGESSFLAYREDLFREAGLEMPENPTWHQIAEFAAELDDDEAGVAGICLRGLPGWGEVMSPLTTVVNTFGGSWFDAEWNSGLTSPEYREAVNFYVDLVREHGQPGAANSGYGDCLTHYSQGRAAMWYDATAMVSTIEDPASSTVAGLSGYAPAPVVQTDRSGWLYVWSLAIPATTEDPERAWEFVEWVTDRDYIETVGEEFGWERVPPGSRISTFENPRYQEVAQAYAQPMREAIETADSDNATLHPVPYEGIGFVAIPEFQDLGTRVSQQISAAIAGRIDVDEALEQSDDYARSVGETYQREEQ